MSSSSKRVIICFHLLFEVFASLRVPRCQNPVPSTFTHSKWHALLHCLSYTPFCNRRSCQTNTACRFLNRTRYALGTCLVKGSADDLKLHKKAAHRPAVAMRHRVRCLGPCFWSSLKALLHILIWLHHYKTSCAMHATAVLYLGGKSIHHTQSKWHPQNKERSIPNKQRTSNLQHSLDQQMPPIHKAMHNVSAQQQ